jgi:hypothetical protein
MIEENLSPQQQETETRQELFRYTDLSHPVMQVLFNLQLDETTPSNLEQD